LLYSWEFRQTVRSIRENLSHMSQTMNQTDTSYTPAEIAKILGMKTSSIYALISRGYLPANRVGTRRVITARQLNHYLINRGKSDQVIDLT
jgi:excisionase family DNA binding protein